MYRNTPKKFYIQEVKNHYMSKEFPYDITLKVGDLVKNSNAHRNQTLKPIMFGKIIKLIHRDNKESNPLAVIEIYVGVPDRVEYDVFWLDKVSPEETFVEAL